MADEQRFGGTGFNMEVLHEQRDFLNWLKGYLDAIAVLDQGLSQDQLLVVKNELELLFLTHINPPFIVASS